MDYLELGGDSRENWRAINQLEAARRLHAQALGLEEDSGTRRDQVRSRVNRLGMHPFKIYNPPWVATPNADTDWRTFCVRAGWVMDFVPWNSDLALFPDGDSDIAGSATTIVVPAGRTQHWIWIELDGDQSSIEHQGEYETPVAAGWTSWPLADATHIPVGYIDTNIYQSSKVAKIRQLLRTDVLTWGGTGEGASVDRATFVSMSTDHIVVRPPGGANNGANDINVAKPYTLRFSMTSRVVDGVTISYSNYDNATQRRTATGNNISQREVLIPRYVVGDEIQYVNATTGVLISGVEVGRIDINPDGRQWGRAKNQ